MIQRLLAKTMHRLASKFPVVSLTGPRQSGKTTLVKAVFPRYQYISLENPDARQRAKEDPNRFLRSFHGGVILDEVQRVPELFSYIQGVVDASKRMGQFILTGSQNFLLLESISQSLAGRVAVLYLLPFGIEELFKTPHRPGRSPAKQLMRRKGANIIKKDLDSFLFKGMYPPIYDRKISPQIWYANYITTYLERDVRQIQQVADLDRFQKFMRLCAGRSAQILNLSALGNECGITHTTAQSWLSVLQASFICFLLQPYHRNFNKRITKQPKLYFYDTGLLSALLGIENASQLKNHYYRGAIFETFIISEMVKYAMHRGKRHAGYFWRDHRGNEIDYLIEHGNHLTAIEIKSGETLSTDSFKALQYFQKIASNLKGSYLIYGGDAAHQRKYAMVVSWKNVATTLQHLE